MLKEALNPLSISILPEKTNIYLTLTHIFIGFSVGSCYRYDASKEAVTQAITPVCICVVVTLYTLVVFNT